MKIAMYQQRAEKDIQSNLKKTLEAIRQAALSNADLVLFPEIHLHEFFPQYSGLHPSPMPLNSPAIAAIQDACRQNSIMAVPNIYLEENGNYYDTSLLIDTSGVIIGIQKMVHIAQEQGFYEQDYYTPSNEGFRVYETEFGRIGMVICFDRHYPESIRTEALRGADLILIPTANTKAEPSDMFEWELKVQAFQNSVAIAMCNRIGIEDEMEFSGESLVVDANGETLMKADDTEQLIICEIDVSKSKEIRDNKPYMRFRRPELYE